MFSEQLVEGAGEASKACTFPARTWLPSGRITKLYSSPSIRNCLAPRTDQRLPCTCIRCANMIFAAIEKVAVQDDDGTLHIPRQACVTPYTPPAASPG
jgi:hypothetical protein